MAPNEAGDWDVVLAPWHLDEELPNFPAPAGALTIGALARKATGPRDSLELRLPALAEAAAGAGRPLVLSGDCMAALGVVAAAQRRHGRVAVIWLDGHGDFNTPETTISGYLGGMPLAALTGRAPELVPDGAQLRNVADSDVALVDARDLDEAERALLDSSGIRRVPAEPGAVTAATREFGSAPVYLHVDVDVMDSSQFDGLRFPAGPGPGLADIEACLAGIGAAHRVVAACVACTWLPSHVGERSAALAITRLTRALGAQISL